MGINCSVEEVGKSKPKFLKKVCYYDDLPWYKCPNSDQYYGVIQDSGSECSLQLYDKACGNDPKSYQACGHNGCHNHQQGVVHHQHHSLLCSTYICTGNRTLGTNYGSLGGNIIETRIDCNGVSNCANTNMDEDEHCRSQQTFTCKENFGMDTQIELDKVCDNTCDCMLCSDEGQCNNMTYYGVWCDSQYGDFIQSKWVCDGIADCTGGEDESEEVCSEQNIVRKCNYRDKVKSLTELHICAAPAGGEYLCSDGMDQVNCSDPSRVALECPVKGYSTSISVFAVCQGFNICDDGYDNLCEQAAPDCYLHTNLFCDGKPDCPGQEDESDFFCTEISDVMCTRIVFMSQEKRKLPIRLGWVFNSIDDCIGKEDESSDYWHKCGEGPTARLVKDSAPCQEVFICPRVKNIHVPFPSFCDKIASQCGIENDICEKARKHIRLTSMMQLYNGPQIALSYCLKGLESVQNQAGDCLKNFEFTVNGSEAIGTSKFQVDMPKLPSTCSALVGKAYIFRSCSNLCTDTDKCVLSKIPDSCLDIVSYPTFSLTQENNLVPLMKMKSEYFFQTFSCANGRCVGFDKVCNFVSDCGDGSDELECTNSFYCHGGKEFIPISSKCDGYIDCQDYSDECNSECPKQRQSILGNFSIKIICWVVSILAVTLNLATVIRSAVDIKAARFYREALTNTMILLISLGDLLMGIYLFAIAIADHTYGTKYCFEQYLWLTSSMCAFLGVLNAVASQMSLFAMTVLSVFRAAVVKSRSMVKEQANTRASRIKLIVLPAAIVFLSLAIGYGPLLNSFEDNFVNGLYYQRNPLFTASISKDIHHGIFKVYFGRYKSKPITWENVRLLTAEMFTSEYGGEFLELISLDQPKSNKVALTTKLESGNYIFKQFKF